MTTALHSGDLGDIVYALASFVRIPGPKTMHLCTRPWTKELTPQRYQAVAPLLEANGITPSNEEPAGPVDYDYSTFRSAGIPWGKNLVAIQADYVKIPTPDYEPWLQKADTPNGRVVIHRSPRYHNGHFPWRKLYETFGDRLLGVGLPNEHEELERTIGAKIEFRPTTSYAELAEIISGASHFVGNQSSPLSIAIGLGVPTTQETCSRVPDCLFPKNPNLQHSITGELTVDGIVIQEPRPHTLPTNETPAGGWIADYQGKTYTNKHAHRTLQQKLIQLGCLKQEADAIIQESTLKNIRDNFPSALPPGEASIKILLQS